MAIFMNRILFCRQWRRRRSRLRKIHKWIFGCSRRTWPIIYKSILI